MASHQLAPLLADLHLLSVLAATRSFTETARRLGVSKASASMRISELERAAGVLLVRRTTRSVGLTEAGQQLVNDMLPAFGRISDSYTAARDLVGTPRAARYAGLASSTERVSHSTQATWVSGGVLVWRTAKSKPSLARLTKRSVNSSSM